MNFIPTSSNARADFRKIALPVTPAQAGSYLLSQVQAGADVALAVEDGHGRDMLDEAAGRLAATRTRVLRAAPGAGRSLTLSSLVGQIAGDSGVPGRGGDVQTKGYRALTQLDQSCDRIALLVSDAQALDRNALDYLKLVKREQSPLSLILAGGQELFDVLDEQNVPAARARVRAGRGMEPPPQPAMETPPPAPLPGPLPPEPLRAQRPAPVAPAEPLYAESVATKPAEPSRLRQWGIAAAAFAAGIVISLLVLELWSGARPSPPPEPSPPAALAPPANPPPFTLPASPPQANPAPSAEPSSSNRDATPPAASPLPAAPAAPADATPTARPATDAASLEEIDGIPIPPAPPPLTGQQDLSTAAPPQSEPPPPRRQTRAVPAPRPQAPDSSADAWDDPYAPDQSSAAYVPAPASVPPSADLRQPRPTPPIVGTFTTDAAGNRVFRLNR